MSHPATVRFDDDEYRRLQRLAERRGLTISELIRDAVRSHFFRKDHTEAVERLMDFIAENPVDVEMDVDDMEHQIALRIERDVDPR